MFRGLVDVCSSLAVSSVYLIRCRYDVWVVYLCEWSGVCAGGFIGIQVIALIDG